MIQHLLFWRSFIIKQALAVLFILIVAILSGCAHTGAIGDDVIITYPRDMFVREDTGETGLLIAGEEWHVLINIPGFIDREGKLTSPNQFFVKTDPEGIIISAFAEQIKGAMDSEACATYYQSRFMQMDKNMGGLLQTKTETKSIGEKKVLVRDMIMRERKARSLYYIPYLKGYCFDFHLTVPATEKGIEKGLQIIDSIKLVQGPPVNAKIKKYFYIGTKRLQITMPGTWTSSVKTAKTGDKTLSTITFIQRSDHETNLKVSPIAGFGGIKGSPQKTREGVMKMMAQKEKVAREKPTIKELKIGAMELYYYDIADKNHNPKDPKDYPYARQGFASLGDEVLYFTILHHDNTRAKAQEGMEIISTAKVLDLL